MGQSKEYQTVIEEKAGIVNHLIEVMDLVRVDEIIVHPAVKREMQDYRDDYPEEMLDEYDVQVSAGSLSEFGIDEIRLIETIEMVRPGDG